MVLAVDWTTDRPWVPIQIHQRAGACFDCVGAGPGAPVQARIQAFRILSITRDVRPLHIAADRLERATRVGDACASAIARRHRARLWFPPCRSSFVYWRTL